MPRLVFPLLAAAVLAAPVAAADEPNKDLEQTLTRAKQDKKFVAVVFTLFN